MATAYYNEFDPAKAAWIRELIKAGVVVDGEVDERSIEQVEPADLKGFTQHHFFAGIGIWPYALRLANWPDDKPVCTGSCPCPPFSAAGQKKACPECGGTSPVPHVGRTGYFVCCICGLEWLADERHLWPEFWRLIRDCRFTTIFGEQVASPDGRIWLSTVRASLEILGYAVGGADIAAASVGAPHLRQRLYFVADTECAGLQGRRDDAQGSNRQPCNEPAPQSSNDGLADSAEMGRGRRGTGEEGRQSGEVERSGRLRDADRLDISHRSRRQEGNASTAANRYGSTAESAGTAGELADGNQRRQSVCGAETVEIRQLERSCESDWLDDSISNRRRTGREDDAQHERIIPDSDGGNGRLEHDLSPRLEGLSRDEQDRDQPGRNGENQDRPTPAAGILNGFWRDADWVLRKVWNRDAWEWCPAKPGAFPLASGTARNLLRDRDPRAPLIETENTQEARVLRLRGYGDSIVPQVAQAFIEAYIKARTASGRDPDSDR